MAGKLKDIPFGEQVPIISEGDGVVQIHCGTDCIISIFDCTSNQRDDGTNLMMMATVKNAETAVHADEGEEAFGAISVDIASSGTYADIVSHADETDYACWADKATCAQSVRTSAACAFYAVNVSKTICAITACEAVCAYCADYADCAKCVTRSCWADEAKTATRTDFATEASYATTAKCLKSELMYMTDFKYDMEDHAFKAKYTKIGTNGIWTDIDWSIIENGSTVAHC